MVKLKSAARRANTADLDQHVNAALALHQQGRIAEAEALYRQVLAVRPQHAGAQHFLGMLLHQTNRRSDGFALLIKSVSSAERKNPHFLNNLGTVQIDHGRFAEAADSFRAALASAPGHAQARFNLARALTELGEFQKAAAIYSDFVRSNHFDNNARISLVDALQSAGKPTEALDALTTGIQLRPKDTQLLLYYASFVLQTGDISAAREKINGALELDPTLAEAWFMLSQVKKQVNPDSDLATMESLWAEKSASRADRIPLSFGLGKLHEDLGNYERAFHFFKEGNAAVRSSIAYDEVKVKSDFDQMTEIFDEAFLRGERSKGSDDISPVFILGMPRSGTTLVEQIVSAHPDVHGSGESPLLRNTLARFFPFDARGQFPSDLKTLPRSRFNEAGQFYLTRMRQISGGKRIITDKMPGNFLLLGFIHLMFPDAKIIHCMRRPEATCFSIFKTHFRNSGHQYGYDLGELARFHTLYQKMMNHWRSTVPEDFIDVQYEELVADQETMSRAIIDYLGLQWDPACLDFHKNHRPVRTASVAQVRRPIYTGSLEQWKKYGALLQPLTDNLAVT